MSSLSLSALLFVGAGVFLIGRGAPGLVDLWRRRTARPGESAPDEGGRTRWVWTDHATPAGDPEHDRPGNQWSGLGLVCLGSVSVLVGVQSALA